jgi:hypothetical protein
LIDLLIPEAEEAEYVDDIDDDTDNEAESGPDDDFDPNIDVEENDLFDKDKAFLKFQKFLTENEAKLNMTTEKVDLLIKDLSKTPPIKLPSGKDLLSTLS